ncbi:MAG: hypothetical protein LAP85_19175 [Acidobacteriia bacterium]|nr:hypothetical protein [Terriglobia bacterium]
MQAPSGVFAGGQGAPKPSPQGAGASPPRSAAKPSLDLLLSRANSYWSLLARGQKRLALAYVEPSARENFQDRQASDFSEPRITGLTLTGKPAEVSVTVEVKKKFPMLPANVSWPVTEKWVFRNGNWFVLVEKVSAMPMFPNSPGQAKTPSLSPGEVEKREQAIRDALQFETSTLEFGTVRQGDVVSLSLGYQLTGEEALGIAVKNSPEALFVRNLPDRKLPSGKGRNIKMELLTENYAGEINEEFTTVISRQDVGVSYQFNIHGFVYAPVSSTPAVLKFLSGEREKEIIVRNNSKSEVIITAPESVNFAVKPLPQTLPPGGECRLKVSALLNTSDKNYREPLSLGFAKPVEGKGGLTIGVIFNYEEPKPIDIRLKEIEEWMSKAGLPIKK